MWCATVGVNAGARQLAIAMRRGFAFDSTTMPGGAVIIGGIAGIGAMTMRAGATGATECGSPSERAGTTHN